MTFGGKITLRCSVVEDYIPPKCRDFQKWLHLPNIYHLLCLKSAQWLQLYNSVKVNEAEII